MNTVLQRLYHTSVFTVRTLAALLLGGLILCGFFLTCFATDMNSQLVLTRTDHLLATIPGTAIGLLLLGLLCRLTSQNSRTVNRILLLFVLFWYLLSGAVLVFFSKTAPSGDCYSVYSIAEQLALGNTGALHATDSYLSYYPQQTGLVAYYEIIIRLWKLLPTSLPAYHIIKCLNILWACLTILFQYKTVILLFQKASAASCYLMLALFNLPFLMYTSFVYGEIPSFALFTVGCWAYLRLLRTADRDSSSIRASISLAVLSLLCFAGSVALRKNTLVLMIAVILVTALEASRHRKLRLLLLTFGLVAATLLPLPAITSYYEHRAGNQLKTGVPPMSYFAMGMQESSRADGWYNGFNFYTYQDTGMDTEATNELSRQAIRERLAYFRENPGYAAGFYRNKFLSQWADGTYASRQATLATFGGRREFFVRLYEGDYSHYYIEFCNLYQNLLYLGGAVFCFYALFHKKSQEKKNSAERNSSFSFDCLPLYIGLIGVIGGFLFHMIWEANARYILPYSLLLMPYAAWGLAHLSDCLSDVRSSFLCKK